MGIISAIPLSISALNPSKADETENAIVFNSVKNVITTSSNIRSQKGNDFIMNYHNVVSSSGKWQTVNAGGYFYTTSDTSTDKNAIHDMKTIAFNFSNANLPFTIYFSRDGSFETGKCWSRSYVTKTGGQTIDFEGHPRYFKFAAGSSAITIDNMKITYGCDESADVTWDNNHGVNPVFTYDIEENPISVTYGLYPQTRVNDSGLIEKLEEIAPTTLEEYFWYNDEYYVKDIGNPFDTSYTFSDGSTVVSTDTYFFKCEPIKWNVKGTGTNYTIDCSNILFSHRFAASSNIYANSELRTWLNNEFCNKAFFLNDYNIVSADLSNIDNVQDKVWAGTKDQYEEWYGTAEARQKKVSDFALCNFTLMSTDISSSRNGVYWTRSPYSDTSYDALYVHYDGSLDFSHVGNTYFGVSPALTITLKENAIVFDSSKNHLTSGSTTVTSERGNNFTITSNNVVAATDKWQTVNAGGYFYTTNDESTNKNAFHDMKTITFNFSNANLPFTIYFSRDGSFETGKCWSRSYVTKTGGQTIDFEGHPRYFKFAAGSSAITIDNMKITYGCDESADVTWDNNHGVNPVVNGDTLTYGLFPQTHVSDANLISALTTKAATLGVENEEYFWYNDEYYVKDSGNPFDASYTFSDGATVVSTDTYFFKCEPIKWNVKGTGTNYTIDCSNILFSHRFDNDSNIYVDSEFRTFLNSNLYNKAFFLKNNFIQNTEVSSGVYDKVWAGTKDQYEEWYGTAEARQKKVSDFALCNFTLMSTDISSSRNGVYWTRSPYSETSYDALYVHYDGTLDYSHVGNTYFGVSPALKVCMEQFAN